MLCHARESGERQLPTLSKGLGRSLISGGDFQVRDSESSRTFEVSTVAGFAVTWWIDGPAEEVKIINVREMR